MISPHLQEETLYSAVTFRRLLNSLARPGKINQLACPNFMEEPRCYVVHGGRQNIAQRQGGGEKQTDFHDEILPSSPSANLYALGALLTLLDRVVTFTLASDGQWLSRADSLVQWYIVRSCSRLASPESATFAFFCQGSSGGLVTQLNRGTLLEPESSATAFYCVDQLTGWASGRGESSAWITLELTGPGIEYLQRVRVAGLDHSEIAQMKITRQGYHLVSIYT